MSPSDQANNNSNTSAILIAEDDLDQRNLLIDFAMSQIRRALSDDTLSDQQRQKLTDIQILSVSNLASLEKAVSAHKDIFLAILDCNMPDKKGSPAHDQFIKTNHRITGQHKSADIVMKNLPNTSITMISSQARFQKIINLYYKKEFNININFISKKDPSTIRRNIRYYLRHYIK